MTRSPVFSGLSLAGLAAIFVGNGIGRFAFIAMMPALVQAGWFSKEEASYLGVATLVGYLLGARLTEWLVQRWSMTTLMRASMLACALGYLACAFQGAGMPWYLLWRTVAGVGGALLMVLTGPLVLPHHDPAIRGRVSGVVFSGVGLGAVAAGALVPILIGGIGLSIELAGERHTLLRAQGAQGAWLGMGGLCLVLTLLVWRSWLPAGGNAQPDAGVAAPGQPLPPPLRWVTGLLLAAYTLNAVGYLPHTLFWADYIVRELRMPLSTGGFYWAMFGVGAAIGPLLMGALSDVFGPRRCLIGGFLLKAVGVALPVLSSHPAALLASSLLVGMFSPGIVALMSTYVLQCVGVPWHRRAWGWLTLGFAAAQALAGFAMAAVAARLDSYEPLFVFSAGTLLVSLLCISCIAVNPKSDAATRAIA
jgi:MFS family permease